MSTEHKTTEIGNMNDLRQFLADQLLEIKNGKMTAAAANACSNLAGKILQASKLEMDYARLSGLKPKVEFLSQSLENETLKLNAPTVSEIKVDKKTGEVLS